MRAVHQLRCLGPQGDGPVASKIPQEVPFTQHVKLTFPNLGQTPLAMGGGHPHLLGAFLK